LQVVVPANDTDPPHFSYLYGAINFLPVLGIRILIDNSFTKWREIFKGLSQDGALADFSENLHVSLFSDNLSNEPTFSQIHLV
jgi:hypothetical protein